MISYICDKNILRDYIDDICRLENTCFDDPWSYSSINDIFNNDLYFCFAAVSDNNERNIIGYVTGTLIMGECEIQRICVEPEFRRSGTGYNLINKVINDINADIYLLEVRENNYPAVSLYNKAGFAGYFTRKDYYGIGENALLMRRQHDEE